METYVKKIIDLTDSYVLVAILATCFSWAMTAVGASFVFFFKSIKRVIFDGMLGFTGGVMVAASYFSLLSPAIEISEKNHQIGWFTSSVGFLLGALFLYLIDKIIPHLHVNFKETEKEGIKTDWHKSILLVSAITLHNIPEGLAIGVLFGGASLGIEGATIGAATALTIGIAIQNLPEGTAISMPLRRQGMSRLKSFNYGQLSAIVEPIFAGIGAYAVTLFTPILPYALSFAAGAMIYVVVEEVIPETQRDKYTDVATLFFILGFCVMMILDVSFA